MNGKWYKQTRVWVAGALSWLVVTVAGELIGNLFVDSAPGKNVGHYVMSAAVVVVPALLVAWVVLSVRERRRRRSPLAVDETPPPLLAPPAWRPQPPLCDRDDEVRSGVRLVRANGVVVVTGARDVGTSAVGLAVAQRLIDDHGVDTRATTRFDLRSRSASQPDDAVATAARVVSAFGIDEPADDTGEVLARVARELVGAFRMSGGTLVLDNVTTAEQVAWLVREWPPEGPRLVVVGEPALGELVPHSTVEVGPMSLEDLRELWRSEHPGRRRFRLPFGPKQELDELLRACFGRPRAVKAFAHEVGRPGSTVTLRDLLSELRKDGLVEGPLERVWRAILANQREGLSADAAWLLSALAELPVTGLIKGAVAAMLGVSDDPAALEELRIRNLVEEVDGRYRLPQEIRRAIEGTTKEEDRRAVAARAVPALLRFYREFADLWVARLETDPAGARAWFRLSEPSFRPLYGSTYLDDELLGHVLDDLCAIADALEAWYVRERLPSGLLAVNTGLYGLVERAGRADLAALSAIRVATAHRMARRFGEAAAQLDIARAHAELLHDPVVRAELDAREQGERALLALDRGSGLPAEVPGETAASLINRAVLCMARDEWDEALDHLRRATEVAQDAGDVGAQAHCTELRGVVLSRKDPAEAVRAWQLARATFARIGEEHGEARCLQHLGAVAVTDPVAAGQLLRGVPEPVPAREAAREALRCLARAKALRTGQPDTDLVDHYLDRARRLAE